MQCISCAVTVVGHPRAKYCGTCRKASILESNRISARKRLSNPDEREKQRIYERKKYEKKKQERKEKRKSLFCITCTVLIYGSPLKKYCDSCRKDKVLTRTIEWHARHKEQTQMHLHRANDNLKQDAVAYAKKTKRELIRYQDKLTPLRRQAYLDARNNKCSCGTIFIHVPSPRARNTRKYCDSCIVLRMAKQDEQRKIQHAAKQGHLLAGFIGPPQARVCRDCAALFIKAGAKNTKVYCSGCIKQRKLARERAKSSVQNKRRKELLTDSWVRKAIKQTTGIPTALITIDMVNARRMLMKLTRELRKKNKELGPIVRLYRRKLYVKKPPKPRIGKRPYIKVADFIGPRKPVACIHCTSLLWSETAPIRVCTPCAVRIRKATKARARKSWRVRARLALTDRFIKDRIAQDRGISRTQITSEQIRVTREKMLLRRQAVINQGA